MAIGGRKPKPSEQKQVTGNPGKRPIPPTPSFAPGDSLAPPKRWSQKGFERQEWERIVPELQRLKIAKSVHQGALEGICELYAAKCAAWKKEDYSAHRMAVDAHRKALNEFGLTAASASRVGGTGEDGHSDPTEEFFTGPKPVA